MGDSTPCSLPRLTHIENEFFQPVSCLLLGRWHHMKKRQQSKEAPLCQKSTGPKAMVRRRCTPVCLKISNLHQAKKTKQAFDLTWCGVFPAAIWTRIALPIQNVHGSIDVGEVDNALDDSLGEEETEEVNLPGQLEVFRKVCSRLSLSLSLSLSGVNRGSCTSKSSSLSQVPAGPTSSPSGNSSAPPPP